MKFRSSWERYTPLSCTPAVACLHDITQRQRCGWLQCGGAHGKPKWHKQALEMAIRGREMLFYSRIQSPAQFTNKTGLPFPRQYVTIPAPTDPPDSDTLPRVAFQRRRKTETRRATKRIARSTFFRLTVLLNPTLLEYNLLKLLVGVCSDFRDIPELMGGLITGLNF